MKFKKISAALVGMMVLSALAGCGKSSKNASTVEKLEKNYNQYVTLGDYKGLKYTPTHTTVTDADIKSDVEKLISDNSKTNKITDRAATYGDAVNIDYTGSIDGTEFDGGSTQGKGTTITLGQSGYVDGFDKQIVGHTPGDAFDVKVTFPKNYGNDKLNGKAAVFATTLNYISETVAPDYDDALVASATDYKTTDEYEKAMRKQHEDSNTETDKKTDEQNLLQQVIDGATITEYPESEMKERIQQITDSMTQTAESNNIDLETYLSYYGYTSESFQKEVKSSVESYIREKMVVSKISEEENITVSEKEKDAKVKDLLTQTGLTDVSKLNSQYGYKDDDYYFMVLEDKVIDFIYKNAVIVKASATDASSSNASISDSTSGDTKSSGTDAE